MVPADISSAIAAGDAQRSRTALVVVENTHVHAGGTVVPLETMRDTFEIASRADVRVHLDGARMFNAAVALQVEPAAIAACADSVAFNLNKGLGAPLGSILARSRTFIDEAVRVRQMFGGGWRPAGILAAAGLVALDTMIERLADDHAHARHLAKSLAALPGIRTEPDRVQTNIVLLELERPDLNAGALVQALAAKGVLALPLGERSVRLVTHPDIGEAQVESAIAAFATVLAAVPKAHVA